jgi:NAD(P)-dependent dehydrogenase (short-subunit alcohol dehydrogenase family)
VRKDGEGDQCFPWKQFDGGRVVVGPSTNIRKEEEIQNLIEHIIEKYGALNMLVNNSGGQFIQESSEIRYECFV